jgi:uncharacterized repeat protein (TIGR01451 family)
VGLALLPSIVLPAIPPVGQVITSRSLALYDLGAEHLSVFSNEVSLSVLAVHGPVVTPDGTVEAPGRIARAFAGERSTFTFILRNGGNVDDAFDVHLAYPGPSDFVPARAAVYLDANRGGIIEAGEIAVSEVGPLAPGEEVALVVEATLPGGLAGGETANINLIARSHADTSSCDRNNVVRIVARAEAQVALALEADKTSVLPGDTIGLTLHFANTGERPATAIAISSFIDMNGTGEGTD